MPTQFDAIVIGTGQAGPALAARLAGAGMKVAVIERDRFGGTCVNDGCTPTKTLVASAYAARMAARAAEYGVQLPGAPKVDMKRVKARKDAIVATSRRNVEKWMRGLEGATVYRGHARFTGPNRVRGRRRGARAPSGSLSTSAAGRSCRRCRDWTGCPTSPTYR